MASPDLTYVNLYLSWMCQELCIEPAITLKEVDVTPEGYVDIHYTLLSQEEGKDFAQDFKKLLTESFPDAEVNVSNIDTGEGFDLHITFRLVS